MSDLGLPADANLSDNFETIPDVSVDSIANRVNPNQVASGVTRGVQQLGGANVYSDGGNNQIIVKDTLPRVLMGNQATFGEGFFVSKPGIDATKNTDAAQWIFNSNQNMFKINTSFTLNNNFAIASTAFQTSLVTQPHGLGRIPAYSAFITLDPNLTLVGTAPSVNLANPAVVDGSVGGNITLFTYATVSVDAVNIYFNIDVAHYTAVSVINSAKVYLLQETFI